jgi:uncharacterized protein YcbX
MLTVASIHVHPVKSLAGIAVEAARVGERGLDHDRRYVVVDAEGLQVTAREVHDMLRVRCEIALDGALRLSLPGRPRLRVDPAALPDAWAEARVWRDTVLGQRCGPEADAWISAVTGRDCRLLFMGARSRRPMGRGYPNEVSFADAAPLLVASQASLEALNAGLAEPVGMTCFRPNLVIAGGAPWQEDGWKRIRVGEVELVVGWPCGRCVMVTVDPETAARHPGGEPLTTLARTRLWTRPDGKREAIFGQNVVPRTTGVVRAGDPVTVLETRPMPVFSASSGA